MKFTIKIVLFILPFFFLINCSGKQNKTSKKAAQEVNAVEKIKSDQAFYDAALNGNINLIKSGAEGGFPVDKADENGSTAMMLAAFNGHTEVVRFLLLKGADVNHFDKNKRTALMYASSGPANETVKILLENGAELNVVDNVEGFTALMFAAAEGQMEVLKSLMAAGADISIKDKDGETARDFAKNNGHSNIITLLDQLNKK